MSKGEKDRERLELQELALLFENRTFVDYFNTFLSLPVFGQHVYYNFLDGEFEFEPPIRQRRHLYLDRREILRWLYDNRYRLFQQSPLYTEYILSSNLRHTECDIPGIKKKDENGEDIATFTRNILGTVVGMLLFRESLRGTCGENVYRCWKDIEAWRHLADPVRRMFWKYNIKTKYVNDNSNSDVKGKVKLLAYQGALNFDLMPDDAVEGAILEAVQTDHVVQCVETDEAMLQLQKILMNALRRYWVPRYLIHLLKTTAKETLDILKRPVSGDTEYMHRERRLRCRFMFPTIYQESNISSPATSVFVSKSAGDVPTAISTPSIPEVEEPNEEESLQDGILPTDLLSLWGGPAKDIEVNDKSSPLTLSSSAYSRSFPNESPDEIGKRMYGNQDASPTKHARSPIPIVLTSYLGGKKRTLLGKFPQTQNRIIWSLASDVLACCPFRAFLENNEQTMDVLYLNFWSDVRNYLDTDECTVDELGRPLRRMQAHRLAETYLSTTGEGCNIFSETLKMSLFQALVNNNDVTLLCMAQDIVQESLWEPLKLYIGQERKQFLQQVRGNRYNIDLARRKQLDLLSRQCKSQTKDSDDVVDPMCYFQCATVKTDTVTASPPVFSPNIPSVMSRPMTSYHTCVTEEQMCKAMELTVLCCEFGTSMMLPQNPPKLEDLVDILHSDYGSLHVSRVPTVRHEWLRRLLHKPKINIETIRVSKKVILDKIDVSKLKSKDEDKEEVHTRNRTRLVLRRNGFILDRPTKPKSFIEVLTIQIHYDFFKRFMLVHKAGMPLSFWKAVEDLKDLSNSKTRQIRVTQIMRKFFGKFAKYGATLDCHEEIIRQIPNMDKVTPGILICAQAAVYRSMERKCYPQYLETYPPESETSSPTNIPTITPRTLTPDFSEIVRTKKQLKRRLMGSTKTFLLWKTLCRSLLEFARATNNKSEMQLLDIFLKCEVEKEQQTAAVPNRNISQMHAIERNLMTSNMTSNVQTRVVIRNRLVIMNRLPADLRFWIETGKYLDLVDSANAKGNITSQDTEFLSDKARSIIACYFASEVPPKVQINVPNDMASAIINNLASSGPQRGLFHEAIILLFPLLYHFWKKFSDDWMNGDIPDDYMEAIERTLKYRVASTPHPDNPTPDYTHIREKQIRTTTHSMLDDNLMKIHFSLSEGLSYVFPQPKLFKTPTVAGRRMTKHSLHALVEETSPRRQSLIKQDGRSQTAKSVEKNKSREKHDKHEAQEKQHPPKEKDRKLKEKIIVKEEVLREKPSMSENDRKTSTDRARRLSVLVESLNKEREERVKEQNRKFNKMLTFEDVVAAAINELSDTTSVFS